MIKKVLFLLMVSILWSCGEDESPEVDYEQQILSYINARNIDADKTSSGLYFSINEPGESERPDINSTVVIDIVGRFIDGSQFQSSYDEGIPVIFDVINFIPGLQEGIQLFGRGGEGILFLTPDLGFGAAGSASIPPNAILIFEVVLHDFYSDAAAYNEKLITEYIESNQIDATRTESGLYYVVDLPGEDPFPNAQSVVTVDYHGYLLNGQTFDSSIERGTPLTISLTNVILGWQEGIPLFGTGGKGTLIIPSHLAYGRSGSPPNITPDTPIIFDITLISVR